MTNKKPCGVYALYYTLCFTLYHVVCLFQLSQYAPIHPLSSPFCKAFFCSTIRKRAYSYPHVVITPSLAPPVRDVSLRPPAMSSLPSLVDSYVLLSSRGSRCRVLILWIVSFPLRKHFRRLRRRICMTGIRRFSSQYLHSVYKPFPDIGVQGLCLPMILLKSDQSSVK